MAGALTPRLADTETLPILEASGKTEAATERGWKVLLFNDDITPLAVVIFGLQRAAGLSIEVAEMVTMEAHNSGEAVVRRGLAQEEAETICAQLRRWTAIQGICTGVDCEALRDED